MIKGLFSGTMNLLANTLDIRAEKHKHIASNIANIETPGYKATDINFAAELKNMNGSINPSSGMLVTNSKHIGGSASTSTFSPEAVKRATDYEGLDDNSVGLENEMVKLSDNSMMYSLSVKLLQRKLAGLMAAIKEGR
jgi:flagellar basal-body rod protein FlgB